MFTDILTVLRKEWREIFLMRGSVRSGVTNVLIQVGVIGIVMPWQSGPEWLTSPVGAMIWAWLPIFSSTGIIADSIAGERERHTLETLLAAA
jgi:ABC-2 type transport system permease protein